MSNGTSKCELPMFQGKVNQTELVRRVLGRNPEITDTVKILDKVHKEYGVLVKANTVENVKSQIKTGKIPKNSLMGVLVQDAGKAPTAPPKRFRMVAKQAVPKVTQAGWEAVELVLLVRQAITSAGDKESLKNLIDLL